MSELSVGCIGAGYFSRFHFDAWHRIGGAQPIAVLEQDLAKARATGLAVYSDERVFFADNTFDIIDIITPPATHLAMIRQALAARPRAVICQKPFCQTIDDAQTAVRLADDAGIPLIVHENFRFQPWYRLVRSAIDAGDIGHVLQLTFRLRPGDGQGPHAYLDRQPYFQQMPRFLVRETAVHWIDTFRYLMGEPQRVFADLRRLNPAIAGEDAGYLLFSYADGRRAVFDGNRLLDHAAQNTRCTMGEALIEGTIGTLTLLGDGSVHRRCFGRRETTECLPPSDHAGFGGDCVFALQQHVVRHLQTGSPLENEARDYMRVAHIEAAIYESAELGRWIML